MRGLCAPRVRRERREGSQGKAKSTNFIIPSSPGGSFRRGLFPTDWTVTIPLGLIGLLLITCCAAQVQTRLPGGICGGGPMGYRHRGPGDLTLVSFREWAASHAPLRLTVPTWACLGGVLECRPQNRMLEEERVGQLTRSRGLFVAALPQKREYFRSSELRVQPFLFLSV